MDSGARSGEVLERRWRDVDLDKRQITVGKNKTGEPRVLFFSEATAAYLLRIWPDAQRKPDSLLFESVRSPGSTVNYKRSWDKVTKGHWAP